MGKRKSRKVVKKAGPPKVPKTFDCIFCNHEKAIFCTLDKKAAIGNLRCRMCGVNFQTDIHSLSKEIDVYCDWIDECERVNRNIDKVEEEEDDVEVRMPDVDEEQFRDLSIVRNERSKEDTRGVDEIVRIEEEDDEDLFSDLMTVDEQKEKKEKKKKEEKEKEEKE